MIKLARYLMSSCNSGTDIDERTRWIVSPPRGPIIDEKRMYKINDKEFDTLTQAMEFAKSVAEFVVITGGECEIVGCFGVDSVKNGVCPSGIEYTWKKRRI